MPDLAPMRLACPACLGVVLQTVSVEWKVEVHHCRRCGGTWLPREKASRLRQVPAAAIRATLARDREVAFVCHSCHGPMGRNALRCRACGWGNALECPACGREMRRKRQDGVMVDVCRACKAMWLDHHELSVLWTAASATALAHAGPRAGFTAGDMDAGTFLLDVLWHAPDLPLALVHGGFHAAGHAAGAAADVVVNAPELVGGAAEAAAEAAGSVFDVIVGIIGGIFDL